jgi:hypothetical protein
MSNANTTPSTESVSSGAPASDAPIVARAGKYYRNTRYLMVAILVLYGAWSLYDGFVKWPLNNYIATLPKGMVDSESGRVGEGLEKGPHTDLDIALNKGLGIALPPLGIALLVWFLYQSRGAYRFENGTLHVPGHPPVKLDEVVAIDKSKWDRKGIAIIEYATASGAKGSLKLDDFVYDRTPTDEIFKIIDDHVTSKVEAKKEQMRPVAPTTVPRPVRKPPVA